MELTFTYGTSQRFRRRHGDLNLIGRAVGAEYPLERATYRLNGGPQHSFYVEPVPDPGLDWTVDYKNSPAVNRLKNQGDFNIEIPVTDRELVPGGNALRVIVRDAGGTAAEALVKLDWNPEPVSLPLELADLSGYAHIQEVGQVVNGAFDLDRGGNAIRSREPVYPDSLLLLGSAHGSQAATYRVVFTGFDGVKWLGPSDFFAGNEAADPPIGIKPGWSSAGMAALNPHGEARSFLAWGDHSGTEREWVVKTEPPARFEVRPGVPYRVRHRVLFREGVNTVCFRIWPEGDAEPDDWLCEETDAGVAPELPRHTVAAFGLFQHSGRAIEWSDIRVVSL
ncbi:MAG: hypothetical protein V3T00_09100 [bacterium]